MAIARTVVRLILLALILLPMAGCLEDISSEENEGLPEELEPAWPAWGLVDEAILRPGSPVGNDDAYCTFNFLYESPNGTGYVGTAAHCTTAVGEEIGLVGYGPIGVVVYDSDDIESLVDFSLIQLHPDVISEANPTMWTRAGPTGIIHGDELAEGDILHLYGYGAGLGENEQSRSRSGVLVTWNEDEYQSDMPAVYGDSGGPLLHEDGKAFGIISRFGFANIPPSTDTGPLMDFIFRELANAGFADVRLATV